MLRQWHGQTCDNEVDIESDHVTLSVYHVTVFWPIYFTRVNVAQ